MTKQKLYLYFLLVGVLLPFGIIIWNQKSVVNYGDTYFVITPMVTAIVIAILYLTFAANYFLVKNHTRFWFGMANLFVLVIPTIFFFYDQYRSAAENYDIFSSTYNWQTVYIPGIMLFLFLLAILMFVINLSSKYWKRN